MTKARVEQISLDDTPWYHVVNRCVRRAFLCGVDSVSGNSYEHRREWIETRILQLANVFSIDVAAYAVMSNHYHIVVRVDQDRALNWSRDEVLEHWTQLFAGNPVVKQYMALADDEKADDALLWKVDEFVEIYRKRLFDLSWFMRVLNESIARMANKEDNVKGHFWEGRFKSQALLDEQAVLSVMAYVDLNPIRANMAEGLHDSEHTSIYKRLCESGLLEPTAKPGECDVQKSKTPQAICELEKNKELTRPGDLVKGFKRTAFKAEAHLTDLPQAALMVFDGYGQKINAVPFALSDYIELVEYLGQAVHPNKTGFLAEKVPKIMQQLGLNRKWLDLMAGGLVKKFGFVVGCDLSLMDYKKQHHKQFLQGVTTARKVFA
jgi:REP element-mobilizing transposase RayT